MLFISFLFLILPVFILYFKYRIIIGAEKLAGEIVGFIRGAKSTHGLVGYNYRVRLKVKGEIYIVTAIQSAVGSEYDQPTNHLGKFVTVYYNRKHPERVSIKGFYKLEAIASVLFVIGLLCMLLSFA